MDRVIFDFAGRNQQSHLRIWTSILQGEKWNLSKNSKSMLQHNF